MKKNIYPQFEFAKKKKNLKIMADLYYQNPKEKIIKFEYAKLLVERKLYEEGKELLLELLNTDNEDYALLELGKLYASENNIDEARNCFNKLLKQGDSYAKLELGMLEMHQGNYDIARDLFNELISKYDNHRAKLELAKLESMIGNKVTAHEGFSELTDGEGGYIATYNLGMLERENGHFDKAKELFISLFDKPNSEKAKFEVAKIEAEIGNINEARFYFQELIGTSKDMHARFELARLESRVQNFEKARKIFEDLYEETGSPYVLAELGILEGNTGNIDKARKHLNYLALEEHNEYGYRLLLMLETKQKNYLEALKLINEMMKYGYRVNMHTVLHISKELNIFFKNYEYRSAHLNYCNKQILNYSKEEAMKHITDRHYNSDDSECFNRSIDVLNLFNTFKEKLDEKYKINGFSFNDIYVIPSENIGLSGQNYVKVVTLPNTHDIISMYPVYNKYDVSDDDEELLINKQVLMKRKGN